MKIRFRQSGGVAGLLRGCELDTEELDAKTRETIEKLVMPDFFSRSRQAKTPGAGDQFTFEIAIERGGKATRLSFDDLSVPDPVAPLLEFLQRRAKPRRPD